MHKPEPPIHPPEHPEQHEHRDIRFKPLAITVLAIIAFGIGTHLMLYRLFFAYEKQEAAADAVYHRSAVSEIRPATVPVPLQGIPGAHANTPAQDMNELRQYFQQEVSRYGKGDEPGTARVPVARAMELLLQQPATQRTR